MVGSLCLIDIYPEDLIKEMFFLSYFSKGGFTVSDIKQLDMNEYEIAIAEAGRIQKMLNTEEK